MTNNPSEALREKIEHWGRIWTCNDATSKSRACTVIRKAIATAMLAGDIEDDYSGTGRADAAKSFRKNTSIGWDNWPFSDLARCQLEDLDRFASNGKEWPR